MEMEFFDFGIDLFAAECTCATRLHCKHAAGPPTCGPTMRRSATARFTGQSVEPIWRKLPPLICRTPAATSAASDARRNSHKPCARPAPELSSSGRAPGSETTPRSRTSETDAQDNKAAPDIVAYLLTARGELTIAKATAVKGGETKLNADPRHWHGSPTARHARLCGA